MGSKINPDKRWGWLNEDLQKYIKSKDYWNLGSTYYEMAEMLKGEGKDDSKLRELGYKAKKMINDETLNGYRGSGVKRIEILATETSCDACKLAASKLHSLSEALVARPLPVKECLNVSGCRCAYAPVD